MQESTDTGSPLCLYNEEGRAIGRKVNDEIGAS